MLPSNELSHIGPRGPDGKGIQALAFDQVENYNQLAALGIVLDESSMNAMYNAVVDSYGQDAALVEPLTGASISTPVQFLQAWLPGFVHVVTAPRMIDELVGITTQGAWEDEEIVQGVLELTGTVSPYGDYTSIPLSSWNVNFERRTIVRFEEGIMVGKLEEKRAARIRIDTASSKRNAAGEALEINRNLIGFFGYNNGSNRTYGLLNDPNLPAFVPVVDPGAGTEWVNKDFLQITADVRSWMAALRTNSNGRINPGKDDITIALAVEVIDQLTTTSEFGQVSVLDWIEKSYPNTRIMQVPEFDQASGGDNVAYIYAEQVSGDMSTDDNRTFVQVVPTKFQTLGVEQRAKSYVEDYSNATAGILTKRPWAVFRASGI